MNVRLAGLLALALTGCVSMKKQERLELLHDSIEAYNHAFVWKNYDRAAAYRPAELRPAFLAAYEDDQSSLQVEDYQIVKVEVRSEKAADVTVKLRYMMLPSTSVKSTTVVQHWAEIDGNWIIEVEDNGLRDLDPTQRPDDPRAHSSAWKDDADEGDTKVESRGPDQYFEDPPPDPDR